MKFNSVLEAKLFLAEIQEFDLMETVDESYKPTNEQLQSFLKVRTPLVKKLKDYRKSSKQKTNWRENRYKMMKGIKAFHKSVEGKRFHKRLGRFLATRITRKNEDVSEDYQTLMSKRGYIIGLNSAKQHLLVELEYFHQLEEHVQLEEFIVDYALPFFQTIEEKIVNDKKLDDNELTFLFDITENKPLIQSLSDKADKSFEEVEKMWNATKKELIDSGNKEDDSNFFPFLVTILKKKLRIEDAKN
jgi:hypothetical protein